MSGLYCTVCTVVQCINNMYKFTLRVTACPVIGWTGGGEWLIGCIYSTQGAVAASCWQPGSLVVPPLCWDQIEQHGNNRWDWIGQAQQEHFYQIQITHIAPTHLTGLDNYYSVLYEDLFAANIMWKGLTLIAPAGVHKGHTFFSLSVTLKKYLWNKFENLGNFLFLHKVYIHKNIFIKKHHFSSLF